MIDYAILGCLVYLCAAVTVIARRRALFTEYPASQSATAGIQDVHAGDGFVSLYHEGHFVKRVPVGSPHHQNALAGKYDLSVGE